MTDPDASRLPVDHPRRRRRTLPVIAGLAALGLALGLGALVTLRATQFGLDAEWMEEVIEHRHPAWEVPSRVFDAIGGGWVAVIAVPVGVGLALLIAKRPWAALYWVTTLGVSALLVQLLKALYQRARPEDILVTVDPGSFPSGHTTNAVTLAVVLALVFRRWWVWLIGALYAVAMALSRTYLGAHWITDTVGGALIGAAVAVLAWTIFAARLRDERRRRERATG